MEFFLIIYWKAQVPTVGIFHEAKVTKLFEILLKRSVPGDIERRMEEREGERES